MQLFPCCPRPSSPKISSPSVGPRPPPPAISGSPRVASPNGSAPIEEETQELCTSAMASPTRISTYKLLATIAVLLGLTLLLLIALLAVNIFMATNQYVFKQDKSVIIFANNQVFLAYPDHYGTWYQAKDFCEDRGLKLPEPHDSTHLAREMYNNDRVRGAGHFWLGGQGDGTNMTWLSGRDMPTGIHYWYRNTPGTLVTSSYCAYVIAGHIYTRDGQLKPGSCSSDWHYFICQPEN